MKCSTCPYIKFGITIHYNLESAHIDCEENVILCPFICETDINYDEYEVVEE